MDQNQEEVYTWVDWIIHCNPAGANKFACDNGYMGYMQPQSNEELRMCINHIIANSLNTGKTVSKLLKHHPEYEAIKEDVLENKKTFLGSSGNESTTSEAIDSLLTRKNLLLLLGALLLMYLFKKS